MDFDLFQSRFVYKNYKIYPNPFKEKLNLLLPEWGSYEIIFTNSDGKKINNDELLYYCKNNPVLLFSEISKYLINNNQYSSEQTLIDEKNHILDIRKSIFENKKC